MKFNKKWLIILILILLDQLSKIFVIQYVQAEKVLINNLFSINLVNNTGIAFGINSGENLGNIIMSILFIFIIIRFMIKQKNNIDLKTEIVLYMILAGGTSNLIDRIVRGSVVDFISIKKFPIFNIADIYIVVGWIAFIIFLCGFLSNVNKKVKE